MIMRLPRVGASDNRAADLRVNPDDVSTYYEVGRSCTVLHVQNVGTFHVALQADEVDKVLHPGRKR